MKNTSRAAVSLIALLIGIGVVFAEVAYYLSHPRVDHSLTLVLFALGVGLAPGGVAAIRHEQGVMP